MNFTTSEANTPPARSCCAETSRASISSPRWSGHLPIWLRSRWGILLGVAALAIGGAALGWPWLVAIGIAPILLSVAPCAVMCALGLCMMGRGKNAPGSQNTMANAAITNMATAPLDDGSDPVAASPPAREPERITVS